MTPRILRFYALAAAAGLAIGCGSEGNSGDDVAAAGSPGAGGAGTDCAPGTSQCGTACVDLQTSDAHCGSCDQPCAPGTTCVAGVCTCQDGQALCSGRCVDLTADPNNCGACGQVCVPPEGCVSGTCACPSGYTACSGQCIDTASDPANCGDCGIVCDANQVCSVGVCSSTCATGRTQCGQACVDLTSDALNCGQCGLVCAAGQICSGGICGCAQGLLECSGQCVDPSNNAAHCGACDVACGAGQSCENGTCVCPAGQMLCDAACVDVSLDTANCGDCGVQCSPGQSCVAGVCTGGGTGGSPGTGGAGVGGSGTGGSGTGGSGTGGSGTGGSGTGGSGTGGSGTGGSGTGGGGTGGSGTGGSGTGGSGTGGDQGTGGAGIGGADIGSCPRNLEGFGENVTGGLNGNVVTASTGTEIHAAICGRPADDTPLIIMVDGTITPGNTLKQDGSCNTADGLIELKEISNISLIGVGTNGVLDQIGVHIRSSSNIIIQNLTIRNVRKSNTDTPSNGGDAIGMESDVHHIWVDHNLIHGSTTEGEEHDGLIDMKANTTDVTVSWNHMHTSGRGGLVCSNDDGDDGSTRITWHHNWYENLNSRTHLVREAHGHFYNNYYSQILSTGINCRNGAQLLIDGNYFTDARNPLGTFFYTDNPGVYEVHDNFFDSSIVWESSSDQIPAGPNVQSTGSVSVPYSYTLDLTQQVPAIAMACVGVGKI